MNEDFGSSLFRIQTGVASTADMLSVIDSVTHDTKLREHCAGLSGFVSDMPLDERRTGCETMLSVYFANCTPEAKEWDGMWSELYMHNTTMFFVLRCCPPPQHKWFQHVKADYDRKGKPTRAVVSTELARTIEAFEQLWGVPGHLVVPAR